MTTATKGKRLKVLANHSRKTLKHLLCTRAQPLKFSLRVNQTIELLFETQCLNINHKYLSILVYQLHIPKIRFLILDEVIQDTKILRSHDSSFTTFVY